MNIIIVPCPHGKSYCIRCNHWYLFGVPVLVLAVLLGAASSVSYYLAAQHAQAPIIARWKQDIHEQRQRLMVTVQETEANIDALSQRLGALQAHVNRLDALGGRLVDVAKLDGDEFDFAAPPGVGGPAETGDQGSTVVALDAVLDALAEQLQDREAKLRALDQLIMNRNLHAEVFPSGRPIKKGWISSRYGKRTDPFTGKQEFHKGMDFAGKRGSGVIAVAGGVVTWAGKRSGYGNLVEIDHGGHYTTRYGHNQEVLVGIGDTVKKGQVIAKMGNTGRSTGPHVHFEVRRDGRAIDPARYIRAAR
jgi:murein DD-endopeptidase MepM/ murein hydrolase activator NlpD